MGNTQDTWSALVGLDGGRRGAVERALRRLGPSCELDEVVRCLLEIEREIVLGADAQAIIELALASVGADPRSTVKWIDLLAVAARDYGAEATPILVAGLLRPWRNDGTVYGPYSSLAVWLADVAPLLKQKELAEWGDGIRAHFKGVRSVRVRALVEGLLPVAPGTAHSRAAELPERLAATWAIDSYGEALAKACLEAVVHRKKRKVRVAVFADGDIADVAAAAGADHVGVESLCAQVAAGWVEFDVALAMNIAMPQVARLAPGLKALGLFPSRVDGIFADVAALEARLHELKGVPVPQGAVRIQLLRQFETLRIERVILWSSDGRTRSYRVRKVAARFPTADGAGTRDPLVRELRKRLQLEKVDLAWGDTGELPTLAVLHEHYRVVTAVAGALVERGVMARQHEVAVGDHADDGLFAVDIADEVRRLGLSPDGVAQFAAALYETDARRSELYASVAGGEGPSISSR